MTNRNATGLRRLQGLAVARRPKWLFRVWLCLAGLLWSVQSPAAGAGGQALPLSPVGIADYRAFLEAPDHRAFAIAPGGGWGWASGAASPQAASDEALAVCQQHAHYRCVPYAVDARTVFDDAAWAGAWRPDDTPATARTPKPATGSQVGDRFPDVAFTDAAGRRTRISALRGKTVVVHLWGAWCPPCRHELPELAQLHEALKNDTNLVFVILQVREAAEFSRQWAARNGLRLPLADSGADPDRSWLTLANGQRIEDRVLADVFPSTVVLDRQGRVVFSQRGPLHGWPQYAGLLRNIASSRADGQ